MTFKGMLQNDIDNVFANPKEFGEVVELVRNGAKFTLNAIYDRQALDGSDIGADVEAISHRPRLFVNSAKLPGGEPMKGDTFILQANEWHKANVYVAVDFAKEIDGSVTYELQIQRGLR